MANENSDKNLSTATSINQQFMGAGLNYTKPENQVLVTDPNAPKDDTNTELKVTDSEKVTPAADGSTVNNTTEDTTDWKAKFLEAEEKLKNTTPTVITKILTQDEIAAQQAKENEEVLKYVVLDKKLSAAEWERYNKTIDTPAKDYLFEKFKAERKAEDQEATDSDILTEFESEYGLNATNEKALDRAKNRLEIEANVLKQKEFSSFHNLRDEYKAVKTTKEKASKYSEFVSSTKPVISITVKPEGFEEPVVIPVDYTDIDAEIRKELLTPELFSTFTKEGINTEKAIQDYITDEVKRRKNDIILNTAVDALYQKKMLQIREGSVAPPKPLQGSQSEEKKVTHPGLTKIMADQGIIKPADTTTK